MIHMIQNAKAQAAELTLKAYRAAAAEGALPEAEIAAVPVEIPKDTKNGDFTTTFALAASKALRQPPRAIAQAVLDRLPTAVVLDIGGGRALIEAEVYGDGIMMYLLSQKSWVKVIAPDDFVAEYKAELQKMIGLYE